MRLSSTRKTTVDEGSLDQYLREISQYPLITREDEAHLARLIRKQDEEALDKLVRSNLRFVVSVAKKYQNQGVSLSDLINEGNLGLIRAAHKFDETKGIKFISYAVWWIRQAILQALAEQSRIVRVPLNRAGTLHRIGKRSSALQQELGREPTVEEIAEGMDISRDEVAKTLSISQSHLSLDAPLTPGEDNKLIDYLPDTQNAGPDEEHRRDKRLILDIFLIFLIITALTVLFHIPYYFQDTKDDYVSQLRAFVDIALVRNFRGFFSPKCLSLLQFEPNIIEKSGSYPGYFQ